MIILKNTNPIGAGDDRLVYLDPTNPGRCIKIPRINYERDFRPAGFNETLYWLSRACQARYFDFNYVDVVSAEALKNRNSQESFTHIPYCYGYIETDLGTGVSWQYIVNHDNSSSLSLKDYSDKTVMLTADVKRLLWRGLDDFFTWQLEQVIMLREIAYSNTLVRVQQDGTYKLYHIDAIGCADLIPLAKYSRFIARLRIRSKVGRFRKRMLRWLGPPPALGAE
ncbi:MAG: YrbL family protein [Desulfocapsaceae bacterium]|jgi:hypothetical protein|nr:YrbL family protein [Desulfocapsaceae bacterium]